jgi:hypothetical protein
LQGEFLSRARDHHQALLEMQPVELLNRALAEMGRARGAA